jgi:hypothetical protein
MGAVAGFLVWACVLAGPAGAQPGGKAPTATFQELEPRFQAFQRRNLAGDRNPIAKQVKQLLEDMQRLVQAYAELVRTRDPAVAFPSMVRIGQVEAHVFRCLRDAPPPPGLDPEQRAKVAKELDGRISSMREQVRRVFAEALREAESQGRADEWTRTARRELDDLDAPAGTSGGGDAQGHPPAGVSGAGSPGGNPAHELDALEGKFNEFLKQQIDPDASRIQESLQGLMPHLTELIPAYTRLASSDDARVAVAAGVRLGQLYRRICQAVLALQRPPTVDDPTWAQIQETLQRSLEPMQQQAAQAFRKALQRAAGAGIEDAYTKIAREALGPEGSRP